MAKGAARSSKFKGTICPFHRTCALTVILCMVIKTVSLTRPLRGSRVLPAPNLTRTSVPGITSLNYYHHHHHHGTTNFRLSNLVVAKLAIPTLESRLLILLLLPAADDLRCIGFASSVNLIISDSIISDLITKSAHPRVPIPGGRESGIKLSSIGLRNPRAGDVSV